LSVCLTVSLATSPSLCLSLPCRRPPPPPSDCHLFRWEFASPLRISARLLCVYVYLCMCVICMHVCM
jgi:hypothetical protein